MTDAQKLLLKAQAARTELRKLAIDDATEAAALVAKEKEVTALENRARVATESEAAATGETVIVEDGASLEIRKLRDGAKLGDYLYAALTGRPVSGASAEYAEAMGCAGLMPFDKLSPEAETRAVTPGPASETVTATRPTVPAAFARTDFAALGGTIPMVTGGESHHVALTTPPPASPKAKDAAADAAAAAFTLTKREGRRVTGQYVIRVEDIALLPSMDSDLRPAQAGAVADNVDDQLIDGNGVAPNLSGLFHQATDVNAASAVETFATGVSRFAALIDGKHANGWGDLRIAIGPSTFALYAGLFQSNGDESLFDYLSAKVGVLRVSTRVPAVASMAQKGIVIRAAQGQPIVAPMWSGVEFVVDPYTQAAKGQRVVTAVTLVGSPFVPYGTSQVVQIHPKLAA